MDCPWRRTLASVFLLLSSHNVRVVSQNVGHTGPLPPQPHLRESLRECANQNPGPGSQQMNLYPSPPNGNFQEFAPQGPYASKFQWISEHPQILPFNYIPQPNVPLPLNPGFNIPQINSLPPLQEPSFNTLFSPLPIPLGPSFNTPPIQNIGPIQGSPPYITPIPAAPTIQGQTFNNLPVANLPIQEGLQSNILQTTLQGQILPGSKVPITPVTGPSWTVPPNAQNQNWRTFAPVPNSYSQSLSDVPCSLTTDLTSLRFLPPPNLPTSIPIQSYAPIPQAPIQPVAYQPIVSVDYAPNTPVSSDQIPAFPPVIPSNVAQLYDNSDRSFQTIAEEYTPVPINLQINVPSPIIPEPKITIITAYPPAPVTPAVVTPDISSPELPFGMYPPYPLPPIIIEGRRSRSRSWLPLFLIALIARDGYCGSGGCCCCCPCNIASADIPIPYPIPIPTNNPIIIGKSCRSPKKGPKAKTPDKKND